MNAEQMIPQPRVEATVSTKMLEAVLARVTELLKVKRDPSYREVKEIRDLVDAELKICKRSFEKEANLAQAKEVISEALSKVDPQVARELLGEKDAN